MFTIILDSSNTELSIGLVKEGILLDSTSYEAWQQQSEFMVKELAVLLDKYKVKNEDIKDIIVSIGPGSYTGVRISLTIAKTIAIALNIDIYPVSSLRVKKCDNKPSICLINARSNRSYFGVYFENQIIVNDMILPNDEVRKYIEEHPDYVVCGDTKYLGIEGYKADVLKQALSLYKSLEKCESTLGLKPVYLKD
ncbi:MAG: tRNA (adenosine(37)-N6)-threonylcarbamoyltransferase complex dimerization subunit type 1 TsaB [Bacilli bacterium]|nr:tRNA (adenosine(37)-N6)-threonylcarbamoyltransferase complex dimerization subunit type 1 TsaB [Bacilli bacterium]